MTKKLGSKTTIAKKRTAYIVLGVVALLVLFLCISVLRRVVYGVFGYAIYAYIPALIVTAVLLLIGKKPNVSAKRAILYIALFIMVVVTLHIGLSKDIVEGSSYLPSTYASNTVGGVLIGLIASLLRLICIGNYGIMLAVSFVITAILGLIALYPLILEMGKGKKQKSKKIYIDTPIPPIINNIRKNDKGVYEDDYVCSNSYNESQDSYENERYDSILNVSGTNRDLFSSLTSDDDKYRSKADKSANILFGEVDSYNIKSQSRESNIGSSKYSTLNTLGSDKGINSFITNQKRMRVVEENLKPLSPQEEYNVRFGGENGRAYQNERTNDAFDPMRQYGNEQIYSLKPSYNTNQYQGFNNVAGDMYLHPQNNEYDMAADELMVETEKPKQSIFADRASVLDFINTPLSGEELINMDFARPKRVEDVDNSYMYDDNYGYIQNKYETKREDMSHSIPVKEECVETQPIVPQQTIQQSYEEPVRKVEEPIYKPEIEVVEKVKPVIAQQSRFTAVQEKFNIPQKQSKQIYTSNVMAKEKAPILPDTNNETKKSYVPKQYKVPSYDILKTYEESASTFPEDYQVIKEKIDQTMSEFDVPAEVYDAKKGPTFTMYYLKVGQGYKLSRIPSVKDNLKMRLCVKNLRIHAPIEGQDALGIEIPNSKRDIIGLKSILCSSEFNKDSKGLKFAMGKNLEGAPYIADITKMPHLLVAGSTGTGKSVFLNAVLTSLLFKYSPEDLRMVLIDPKKVELTVYRNLPNLLIKEPVKESKHAVNALRWLCAEMDRRYDFFSKVGCQNIQDYNDLYRKPDEPKMYRILLVVDEMADLMINSRDSSVEDYIVRIAQLARACGIHMIIATQRPTANVITGLIKSNILHRVAFAVKTNMDSRVILDDGGAEELLGNGDMLYSMSDGLMRLQGAYAHISEIKAVCDYIRENNECEYDESIAKAVSYEPPKPETPEERSAAREEERDAEFEKQLQIILKTFIRTGRASVSSAQTAHHVGYIKAKKLVDAMTERGFIGPDDGAKPREILITMEEWEELFGENAIRPIGTEEYDEE